MRTLLLSALLVGGWAWGQTPPINSGIIVCGDHGCMESRPGQKPRCTNVSGKEVPCSEWPWPTPDEHDYYTWPKFTPAPAPEPMDVPAIKGETECRSELDKECRFTAPDAPAEIFEKLRKIACTRNICRDTYTCADKKRILEHDEQELPKYWCRKVQP